MPQLISRTVTAIAAASTVFVAACRDATSGPSRLSALYVLQTINGNHLPAVAASGGGNQYVILADSLVFQPDGNVRRTYVVHWTSTSPLTDTTYTQSFVIPYSVDGAKVTMGFHAPCPINANCIGFDEAVIEGATLRFAARMLWQGAPEFVFARRRASAVSDF
jgi:hypothetical protein